MAQIGTLNTFANNVDEVTSQPLQYNFTEVASKINGHMQANTNVHGVVAPAVIISEAEVIARINKYIPVGTLRYVWDNDITTIRILLDSNMYVEMNGQTVNRIDSLYHNKTLPNLDEAYIVGAGTDGGGNMSAATIGYTTVGSNSYNFTHTHTATHTHDIASHTHDSYHGHNTNTAVLRLGYYSGQFALDKTGSSYNVVSSLGLSSGNTSSDSTSRTSAVPLLGSTPAKSQTSGPRDGTTANNYQLVINSLTNTDVRPCYLKKKCYLKVL